MELGKWKGGWRPDWGRGVGVPGLGGRRRKRWKEKPSRIAKMSNGLSQGNGDSTSVPSNIKAMFLQVLRGNNSNFVFWVGKRDGK